MLPPPPASARRWITAQIGAREHYGVPLALHRHESLRCLYTDAWCRHGRALLQGLPFRSTQALAGRYHAGLPDALVRAFTMETVVQGVGDGLRLSRGETLYERHLRVGSWFGTRVARHLERTSLIDERDAFFAFNTGALEPLEQLRHRGVFTVVDQIDPGRVEHEIVLQERRRWEGWERDEAAIPEAYWTRLAAEWQLADRILVNSEWSRQALLAQGVSSEKLIVVPLAYDPPDLPTSAAPGSSTLTVLWLGSVNLRKGIPYVLQAAAHLRGEAIEFLVAGPLQVTRLAIESAPANVKFLGSVPRTLASSLYRRAHVFVLPTLSDGFAITQLEAMAHGVPVITTARCGQVVTDSLDGLIVPAADGEALASAILRLARNRDELAELSRNARRRSGDFTLAHFAARLGTSLQPAGPGEAIAPARVRPPVSAPSEEPSARRWIVSQIGARQHYSVPVALHARGELRTFFTDAWCRSARPLLSRLPGRAAALAARHTPLLPGRLVHSYTVRTTFSELLFPSTGRLGTREEYFRHLRIGQRFGRRVARSIERMRLDPTRDAFFGFTTGSLEAVEVLRGRGVFTLVDQVDPARTEEDVVAEERRLHPGWEVPDAELIPSEYWHRLASEWQLADAVLVNSRWSQEALVRQGVASEKILVVPLAFEPTGEPPRRPRADQGPLKVLWLGTVNLRKGFFYLVEAARLLERENIEFVVAGPVRVSDQAVETLPPNVKLVGRVQRAQAEAYYRAAEVFAFPTLSDGFGITQLEAMAHGLPVVATPRCGEVVTDGVDGYVIPPADGRALAAALGRLAADRELLAGMSEMALQTSRAFSRAAYGNRLALAVAERRASRR